MAIISLQLLLKGQNLLIPLIKPACQGNHDVTLLQQELLIPVHLQQNGRVSPLCLIAEQDVSAKAQTQPLLCESRAAMDCSSHLYTVKLRPSSSAHSELDKQMGHASLGAPKDPVL